ncbi:MAG: MBL fold metallo-hydrolase [Xanthomonadaceae bacterium]|nr:MBL fold metallo-hydrolase [Xanthomonadaceae bacterium]MDE1964748.1 MBL fold metallo-hydrolase [Xanthomonadaceae bacterium]
MRTYLQTLAFALLCAVSAAAQAGGMKEGGLHLTVYNPGAKSLFPVSSEIVTGPRHALLIDAQFQRDDAEKLVEAIRATGKTLTTIYVSHSDPDYYFGLGVLHQAFPAARIVATGPTVQAMAYLMAGKKAYWGPILKANAPGRMILPQVLEGNRLAVDGHPLVIEGLDGPTPERTFVWIPDLRTVVGGSVVFSGTHVWVADTQTPAARAHWQDTLGRIESLHPVRVVPGHYLGEAPDGLRAVDFTARYLEVFNDRLAHASDADDLIEAMKKAYPDFGSTTSWLELGAHVVMGDTRWPK